MMGARGTFSISSNKDTVIDCENFYIGLNARKKHNLYKQEE